MVYRGKLLAALKQALLKQELTLPADTSSSSVSNLLNRLGRKSWVVHCCPRYEHASGVAKYLARYIKGGSLRNQQLQHISRWLEHVPLHGKSSVRYLGLYSSSGRGKLNSARQQLGQPAVSKEGFITWQAYLRRFEMPQVCDVCGSPLIHGKKEVPVHHAA